MAPADAESERTLHVYGAGVAEADADRCHLHVALHTTAEDTGETLGELSVLVTAVLGALDEEGIPREAVRTTDVTVGDRWDPQRDRVVGREAVYRLRIAVEGLERAGAVVSRLADVAGDSLQMQGLELALSDPQALVRTARHLAVLDAQAKASELAAAAGVTLGEILSIEEEPRGEQRPRRAFAATLVRRSAPPVPPVPVEGGPLSVTTTVALVYRIA